MSACYLQIFIIFWLQTTLTMQFSKLIFSILAIAAVSANPLSAKVALRDSQCDYDCGSLCYSIYGSYANHCVKAYVLFNA